MLSVVFRYLDEERKEEVGISSMQYFKKRMQTAKQLLEVVGWKHTEEQWYAIQELSQQELYELLCMILEKHPLFVEKPN